ncbi:MAG: DNA polymerase III subunit chi [Nitrosomonas sp.]|nr:DNA polymerase III subunit chi [Nitrosomonas sp.]
MVQIFFYSGAGDKLITACRLCAKAVQQQMKVLVYALDESLIKQFDELLWTFSSISFIPHCNLRDEPDLVNMTPVVLSNRIPNDEKFDVLLNLDRQYPPTVVQFKRVIEIADNSPTDKSEARIRYRCYKDAGYEIQHFQLNE